jgi:DNA repair exonuclease SbcCD nuclease subunit
MRLLHIADLHLGWQPRFAAGAGAAELAKARDDILETAVGFAAAPENRIDAVIIAGDLFETHNPPQALVERVIGALGRLVGRGVTVVTVPGNHDERTYPDSVYRRHSARWPGVLADCPHPSHLYSCRLGKDEAHFYGMAYTGGVTRASVPITGFARHAAPGAHIAVLHGTVVGAGGLPASWGADDRSLPLDAPALAGAGYDYIALGHIHRSGAPAGWPEGYSPCLYAGMVAGRGFDETGCGALTVVDIDPQAGGDSRVRTWLHHVKAPGFHEVEVAATAAALCGGWAQAIEAAAASVARPAAVRVRLTGAVREQVDVAALEQEIMAGLGQGHWHVEVSDQTTTLGRDGLAERAGEATVRGFFARNLLSRLDAAEDEAAREVIERAWRYGAAALEGRRNP